MDGRRLSSTAICMLEQLARQEKIKPGYVALTQGSVISACTGAGLNVLRFFLQELDFSERSREMFVDIATITLLSAANYPTVATNLLAIETLLYHVANYKFSSVVRDAIKASMLGFDVSASIAENIGNLYYATMFSMVGKTIGEEFVSMNDDNAPANEGDIYDPENGQLMAKA